MNKNLDLVSIIVPVYNTEKYINETVESILIQSYQSWEVIFIDDASTDNTPNILMEIVERNSKFKYIRLDINSGAAVARNTGVEAAKGEFIAFLDDDDLWHPNKLEIQIEFMKKNKYNFTATYYNKIDEESKDLGIIVRNKSILDYNGLLKNCPGNSTVIYNSNLLGKTYIPPIRKRNDYLMWLKVIKKSINLYLLPEVLSSHRIRKDSISRNKVKLIKYHWKIYRDIEKISFLKSIYLVGYYVLKSIPKIFNTRLKRKK